MLETSAAGSVSQFSPLLFFTSPLVFLDFDDFHPPFFFVGYGIKLIADP